MLVRFNETLSFFFLKRSCVNGINTGSLTALTAKLPSQPLTSHPSVRSLLEKGKKKLTQNNYALF